MDENKKKIKKIKANSFEDRAYGCLLGVYVADSCGSLYEFSTKHLTDEQMDVALTMPGGGPH